jgi:hypothetical protein
VECTKGAGVQHRPRLVGITLVLVLATCGNDSRTSDTAAGRVTSEPTTSVSSASTAGVTTTTAATTTTSTTSPTPGTVASSPTTVASTAAVEPAVWLTEQWTAGRTQTWMEAGDGEARLLVAYRNDATLTSRAAVVRRID